MTAWERSTRPRAATRQSWSNLQPLPAQHTRLDLQRTFTEQEYARISHGFVPQAMEDKWFICLERDVLSVHRSWTGYCIYQLSFASDGAQYTVVEALVNRDPSQYGETDTGADERLVLFLIETLLLGQQTRFPRPTTLPTGIAAELYQQHVAGRGPREEGGPQVRHIMGWLWRWLLWLVRG